MLPMGRGTLALLIMLASSCAAVAHAGEQGFVLLLPTSLYMFGGTAAVVASILLVTCVPRRWLGAIFHPVRVPMPRFERLKMIANIASTFALCALIYIGFFGPSDPQDNLLPLVIWTGFWVALYVVQGVVFDIWSWVSPWRAFVFLFRKPVFELKAIGSVWPALGVYAAFQLFLMADVAPSDPGRLAMIVLLYWLFTMACMALFGAQAWLARGECFSVLFCLIGSLRAARLNHVGMPGWWSIKTAPLSVSEGVFCLVILASGSFDGIRETFWWLAQIGINPLEFPGRSAVVTQSALGLVATNLALIAAFVASLWIGLLLLRRFGDGGAATLTGLFRVFSISILPIALGYHFAHYFVGFLVQSQYLIIALGDPLAQGGGPLGFQGRRVTTGFLFTPSIVRTIWLTQAGVVVGSHILAVLMAHHLSGRFAQNWRDQLLVQAGLGVLMVGYTVFGLWLLASPRGA